MSRQQRDKGEALMFTIGYLEGEVSRLSWFIDEKSMKVSHSLSLVIPTLKDIYKNIREEKQSPSPDKTIGAVRDVTSEVLECCWQNKVYPAKWTSLDGDPDNNCMKCAVCHSIVWSD